MIKILNHVVVAFFFMVTAVSPVLLEAEELTQEAIQELNGQLFSVTRNGNAEEVKKLIEAGADIEARENSGATALNLAAWNGHVAVVEYLLRAGADI